MTSRVFVRTPCESLSYRDSGSRNGIILSCGRYVPAEKAGNRRLAHALLSSASMAPSIHDSLFKSTFSEPERAMGLVLSAFPTELTSRLDVKGARLASSEYAGSSFRQKRSDLLFETRLGKSKAFVHLLVEHQSEFDPWMPLRILEYSLEVWRRWLKLHPRSRSLPIILPLVVSHAPEGWRASPRFSSLYGLASELRRSVGPFAVDFQMGVKDLANASDERIRALAMDALGRITLLALKHARTSKELGERILEWAQLAEQVAVAPHGLDALAEIVEYLWSVGNVPREVVPDVVERLQVSERTRRIFMTTAEQLFEHGMKKGVEKGLVQGIEQGIEKGIEQGVEQGERGLFLRVLVKRFGPLPQEIETRIANASSGDIEGWTLSLLDARTLGDLFS